MLERLLVAEKTRQLCTSEEFARVASSQPNSQLIIRSHRPGALVIVLQTETMEFGLAGGEPRALREFGRLVECISVAIKTTGVDHLHFEIDPTQDDFDSF